MEWGVATSRQLRGLCDWYGVYVAVRGLHDCYAVVTPLRKAGSYEPRTCIAILEIWGDTWLTRGKYGIYVAVRGSYGGLTGSDVTPSAT